MPGTWTAADVARSFEAVKNWGPLRPRRTRCAPLHHPGETRRRRLARARGAPRIPVHQCCLVAMGVPLLDNLALAELAAACAERSRYEFLLVVAPLRVEGGTGSPVNPIAVF